MHKLSQCGRWLVGRGLRDGVVVGGPPDLSASVRAAGGRRLCASSLPHPDRLRASPAASLDFVLLGDYGDGSFRHGEARVAVDAAVAAVRPGGVVAGLGHFDGVLRGAEHGVRRAVAEAAGDHGLLVGVTLDLVPAWWAVREPSPTTRAARPPQRVLVLTGHDGDPGQAAMAALSTKNKQAYCRRHGYDFRVRTDGFDPSRHPAWGRVNFLANELPRYDWVWWTDVDSLVMNAAMRLERFLDDDCDLLIACEDLGLSTYHLNSGQFFLRNTDWSAQFLRLWWEQTSFLADRLQEQRALIHLVETRDLNRHVRVVAQRHFNAFPPNYRPGDFVLHFAGLTDAERLPQMRAFGTTPFVSHLTT